MQENANVTNIDAGNTKSNPNFIDIVVGITIIKCVAKSSTLDRQKVAELQRDHCIEQHKRKADNHSARSVDREEASIEPSR